VPSPTEKLTGKAARAQKYEKKAVTTASQDPRIFQRGETKNVGSAPESEIPGGITNAGIISGPQEKGQPRANTALVVKKNV